MKQINGFENYSINKDGRIWSFKSNKWLKCVLNKGYKQVGLRKDGKRYNKSIHRLVAETYIKNPENKREVDHIDGDKTNNNVDNLRWATSKENKAYAWDLGLYADKNIKQSKINIEKINSIRRKKVYSINKISGLINKYDSINNAAKIVGTSSSNICKVLKGKMKSCKGYYWNE